MRGGEGVNAGLLKLLLYQKKISQAELSRRIGISDRAMSQKITGKVDFQLKEVIAICKELGIEDPRSIFFDGNDKAECLYTPLSQ